MKKLESKEGKLESKIAKKELRELRKEQIMRPIKTTGRIIKGTARALKIRDVGARIEGITSGLPTDAKMKSKTDIQPIF